MIKKFLYFILVLSFISCAFQKRLYRKGFYVEKIAQHPSLNQFKRHHHPSYINHQLSDDSLSILKPIFHPNDADSLICSHIIKTHNYLVGSTKKLLCNIHSNSKKFYSYQQKKKGDNKNSFIQTKLRKDIDPVLKTQYISVLFYLYLLMLCINYYNFFYMDPFFWFSSMGGVVMLIFLFFLLLFMFIAYLKEKKRNYNAYNVRMSKIGIVLNMLIMGPLLHISIFIDSGVNYYGWNNLPYSVGFFWMNIIVSTIILLVGLYFLFFTNKKDALAQESNIVETAVTNNSDLFKKIQRLRKIKLGIYILSFLLVLIAVIASIIALGNIIF